METWGFNSSEQLFYGGIVIMAAVAVLAILCIVVFVFSGRRLKKKLEEEYGCSWRHVN